MNNIMVSRRWVIGGVAVSTTQIYTAAAAGTLAYKITARELGKDTVVPPTAAEKEAGQLQRLTLAAPVNYGVAASNVAIQGAKSGSLIEVVYNGLTTGSSGGGMTVASDARTISGTPTARSLLLRETSGNEVRNSLIFFPTVGQHTMRIGMGLAGINYYSPNRFFINRFAYSGAQSPPSSVDANGMPQGFRPGHDISYLVSIGLPDDPPGNYVIVTDGDMDITGFTKNSDGDYVKMMPAGFNFPLVIISAARAWPTYMAIMKENEVAAYKAGQRFQQIGIDELKKFKSGRFMNWHGGNFTDALLVPPTYFNFSDDKHVPLSLIIELCTQASIDLYINIHHKTSLETFTNVYVPALDAFKAATGKDVYIEHSNEITFNGNFSQYTYARDQAYAMGYHEEYYAPAWWHGYRTALLAKASRGRGYKWITSIQTVQVPFLGSIFLQGAAQVPGYLDSDIWAVCLTLYFAGSINDIVPDGPLGTAQDHWIDTEDYDSLIDNILNYIGPRTSGSIEDQRIYFTQAKTFANAHGWKIVGYEGLNAHLNELPLSRGSPGYGRGDQSYGKVFYKIYEHPLMYGAIRQVCETGEAAGFTFAMAFDFDSDAPKTSPFGRFGMYGLPGYPALTDWNVNLSTAPLGGTSAPPTPAALSHRWWRVTPTQVFGAVSPTARQWGTSEVTMIGASGPISKSGVTVVNGGAVTEAKQIPSNTIDGSVDSSYFAKNPGPIAEQALTFDYKSAISPVSIQIGQCSEFYILSGTAFLVESSDDNVNFTVRFQGPSSSYNVDIGQKGAVTTIELI